MSRYDCVDEYMAALAGDRRAAMEQLRSIDRRGFTSGVELRSFVPS